MIQGGVLKLGNWIKLWIRLSVYPPSDPNCPVLTHPNLQNMLQFKQIFWFTINGYCQYCFPWMKECP